MSPDPAAVARRLKRLYPRSVVRAAGSPPPDDAAPDQVSIAQRYKNDPVGYANDVLKVILTYDQERILRVLPGRVKINSGHSLGKTFLVAVAVNWWFDTRNPGIVITTAPTQRDVVDLLWTEVRLQRIRVGLASPFIGPRAPEMFDHDEHWAKGYTASKSESFHGRHRPSMFFAFDECHDDKTEVLTERGWVSFAGLNWTDRLMTMNQNTGVSEYCLPVRLVRRPYRGEMYEYKCSGSDFCVTPGHMMLWQTSHSNSKGRVYNAWRRTRMDELAARKSPVWMTRRVVWDAPEVTEFILPAVKTDRKYMPERRLSMDDWLVFLGWYFSEGHLIRAGNGKVYGVGITQKDNKTRAEIIVLCARLGFRASESKADHTPQICFTDMQVSRWLAQFGKGCLEKRCPGFIRHLCRRQIQLFLEAYIEGDGSRYPLRDVIYTSSADMASDLNELVIKTGVDSTVTRRPEKLDVGVIDGRVIRSTVRGFIVSRARRWKRVKYNPKHLRRVDYDGMVYCAELPKHNLLLTRRNGKVIWSGNCEGIEPIFWQATSTMYKPEEDHCWVVIGNPITTASQSYLEDLALDPRGNPKWKLFSLSCLNHPNVLAQLRGEPPPIPDAVTLPQVEQFVQDWAQKLPPDEPPQPNDLEWPPGSGLMIRPGPLFLGRVLGVRPSGGVDSAFPPAAFERALIAKWNPRDVWLRKHRLIIGIDASGYGDDDTGIHVRWGPLSLWHETHNGWGPGEAAGRAKELAAEWTEFANSQAAEDRPPFTAADAEIATELDGGYGLGVVSHFDEWNPDSIRVRGIAMGGKSEKIDVLGGPVYYNVRAEVWLEGGRAAYRGDMDLSRLRPESIEKLRLQLTTPFFVVQPDGSRLVEPKKDVKKRLGRSPDDADALLIAYSETANFLPTVVNPHMLNPRR